VKGLIAAFVDPIPFDHGNKILRSLNPEQIKRMKSLQKDFIPVFYEVVRETYAHSQRIYDINLSLDMREERKYTPKPDRNSKSLKLMYTEKLSESDSQGEANDSDVDASDEERYETTPLLSALAVPHGKPAGTKDMPCYSMLRTGKCIKGPKCNFSHDSVILKKGWETAMEELRSSPYNPRKTQAAVPDRPNGKLVEIAKINPSETDEPIPSGQSNDQA
jgi:hypothetical protein